MAGFSFGGVELAAAGQSALWWPARRALIVADLHLEKASWYAARGQMLPPYDSAATIAELTTLADARGARELWCLGDSFHDARGCERLPATEREALRRLTARTDFTWITGNHDRGHGAPADHAIADHCGGRVVAEAVVDGLVLRHEADAADPRPELSGHFHPKLRLTLRGRRLARRCFVLAPTKLILPAFGALTGDLDAADPAIVRAAGRPARALVPVADRMLSFPLAA